MTCHCNFEDNRRIIVCSSVVTPGQTDTYAKSEVLPDEKIMLKWILYFAQMFVAVIILAMGLLCHSDKIHSPILNYVFNQLVIFSSIFL